MTSSFRTLSLTCLFLFVFIATKSVNGFYVPGIAPQDFAKGDIVEVKVGVSS